jgi:Zn-dependent protease
MEKAITFITVIVGWIFSLCLHEFSHAIVAYYGGDTSVKDKGYLTFNPLKYTHPFYSIVLPMIFLLLGGIGLPGGAVYIDTWRLRSRRWQAAVSLAGPAANLVVAIVLAIILAFAPISMSGIWPGLAFLALMQRSEEHTSELQSPSTK